LLAPATGDCGASLIGVKSGKTASFIVTNTGASNTGTPTTTTGDANNPASQQFFASGCPSVLAPGQQCTVTVSFTPTSRGFQTTSVSVAAQPGGQANASVSGTGQAAATFSIAPQAGSSASFPAQPRSSTSAPMTFVATNQGDVSSPLLTTPVTSDPTSFPVTSSSCNSNSIAPGQSCTIQVAFAPQTATTVTSTLNVIAMLNGSVMALGKLQLSGTGLPIWQEETPPASVTTPSTFYSVGGAGASPVYFGGPSGVILQRAAAGSVTWSNVSLNFPNPPDVDVLWGTSNPSPRYYLVHSGDALLSTNAPPNWASVSGAPAPVTGLFGWSASDLWTSFTSSPNNVWSSNFYHWNGSSWATETSPQGGGARLWGTGDGDLFAYGQDLTGSVRHAIVMHRASDGTWSLQGQGQLPALSIAANGVNGAMGMWGFGVPANDVYVITAGQGLYHSIGDGNWAQIPNAPAGTLGPHTTCNAVWGAVPSAVWVACPGGVYVYDGVGKAWGSTGLVASGVTFNALWGSGANDVYAVGGNGTTGVVYHYF
jgi:hypothetical protein